MELVEQALELDRRGVGGGGEAGGLQVLLLHGGGRDIQGETGLGVVVVPRLAGDGEVLKQGHLVGGVDGLAGGGGGVADGLFVCLLYTSRCV